MIALSGVRSSWLMRAMNVDLGAACRLGRTKRRAECHARRVQAALLQHDHHLVDADQNEKPGGDRRQRRNLVDQVGAAALDVEVPILGPHHRETPDRDGQRSRRLFQHIDRLHQIAVADVHVGFHPGQSGLDRSQGSAQIGLGSA